MNIGAAIKRLRKDRGITQQIFSEKVKLSPTSVSQIENGVKRPSEKNLKKICQVLRVTAAGLYLLSVEESDIPQNKRDVFNAILPVLKTIFE